RRGGDERKRLQQLARELLQAGGLLGRLVQFRECSQETLTSNRLRGVPPRFRPRTFTQERSHAVDILRACGVRRQGQRLEINTAPLPGCGARRVPLSSTFPCLTGDARSKW